MSILAKTERDAIVEVIQRLVNANVTLLFVDDGGDDRLETQGMTAEQVTDDYIMPVETAHLYVERSGREGFVWFVLGNDPSEVVADCTLWLDKIIDPS